MTPKTVFRGAFGSYVRSQIRTGLDGVWVRGIESVHAARQSRPVILAATHSAWWDAMLLLPLDDALGRSGRVWMDAANLERLPFFGPLGAIALDTSGIAGLRRSVREAGDWLSEPGKTLWVFPQGEQRPSWIRPLCLHPGAAWMAQQLDAALIPVAIAYGFREASTPSAAVSFGPPVDPDNLEGGLLQQLGYTDRFFVNGDPAFEPFIEAKEQRSEAGAGTRMLAWAARSAGNG